MRVFSAYGVIARIDNVQFVQLYLSTMENATVSCYCGCATCVCSAKVVRVESTIEYPPVVANEQSAEIMKGENLTMPGDVSSTDVVSSGFNGWGSQASLKPAEVALIGTNNPFNPTNFLRDAITHESLRAEIRSVGGSVTGLSQTVASMEARNQQAQIDQLRADKTNGLLASILAAVTKTSAA